MARSDERRSSDRVNLTRRAIMDAAFSLADTEGIGVVTVRRLAKDLDVTPMALYWYFRSKDALLDGMVTRLYEEVVEANADEALEWQEQFRELFGSILAVLRTHPSTASLLATRNVVSESSLRVTETALDILARGGFSPSEATQIVRHALSVVTNLASGLPEATVPKDELSELTDVTRRTRIFLESLPPERFPRLVGAAAPLSECEDIEEYYAFGLDLLLAGIETMARRER